MKLLSIIVPSYNSQDYMRYCVESLLVGGDRVEILIVNDGSTDNTAHIAQAYQELYPNVVRAITQENKGHGGAVNTGISHATGVYVKVVDSDDWVDTRAYLKILDTIEHYVTKDEPIDMFISNFVYEKEGAPRKKIMNYVGTIPENQVFTWDEVGQFKVGQYMMMHSIIYRLDVVKQSQLRLPEHTFYVDNLFIFVPLQYVKTMYYLNLDFYRYFIGRNDQSVNETVMIRRIDQQLKVNKLLVEAYTKMGEGLHLNLRAYLRNHLEITTVISSALLNKAGTPEHMKKKKELWQSISTVNFELYQSMRKSALGKLTYSSSVLTRQMSNSAYAIAKKIFGFN